MAAILATDEPKKDGAVLVPGPSRLFERGGDAVALATFKHEQEARRNAQQAGALHYRQMQQKQSEAKAVQALKIRKSLGGTLWMAPTKPAAAPASTLRVPGTAPMPAGRGSQQQYQGGMTAAEAEKLMRSKSKHSAEARSVSRRRGGGVDESVLDRHFMD